MSWLPGRSLPAWQHGSKRQKLGWKRGGLVSQHHPPSKIPDGCREGIFPHPVQDRDEWQVIIPTKCLWHLSIIPLPSNTRSVQTRQPGWPRSQPGASHQASYPLGVPLHLSPSWQPPCPPDPWLSGPDPACLSQEQWFGDSHLPATVKVFM